jgi:hypothetical protein
VRRGVALAAVVCLALGCVDGPFERRNPFDPKTSVTARLEVVTDTVSELGEIAVVQLITDPQVDLELYPPLWRSGRSGTLESLGGGLFRLIDVPATPTRVTISAAYPAFTVSAVIVAGRP